MAEYFPAVLILSDSHFSPSVIAPAEPARQQAIATPTQIVALRFMVPPEWVTGLRGGPAWPTSSGKLAWSKLKSTSVCDTRRSGKTEHPHGGLKRSTVHPLTPSGESQPSPIVTQPAWLPGLPAFPPIRRTGAGTGVYHPPSPSRKASSGWSISTCPSSSTG